MHSIIKLSKIDIHEWKNAFETCRTSNYFFSPKWLLYQAELFHLQYFFYKVSVKDIELYIPFQKHNFDLFSNFIAYGGFMANDYVTIDSKLLFSVVEQVETQLSSKLKRMKTYPLVNYQTDFAHNCQITAILKLYANLEIQTRLINKKNRYEIKKSITQGVRVKQLSFSDVKNFYSLYLLTMKRVGSKYLSPLPLFEYCFRSSDCIVLGAYLNNELIAGSIFACCENGIYHWFNVSSDTGKKTGANYGIIDSIIKKGIESSYSFINLGSSHSDSILIPKLRWGSQVTKYISLDN